jgi:hypothetical protein
LLERPQRRVVSEEFVVAAVLLKSRKPFSVLFGEGAQPFGRYVRYRQIFFADLANEQIPLL